MIIPRSKGNYKGMVAVNGFGNILMKNIFLFFYFNHNNYNVYIFVGFYGLLLFSNETSLNYVK